MRKQEAKFWNELNMIRTITKIVKNKTFLRHGKKGVCKKTVNSKV